MCQPDWAEGAGQQVAHYFRVGLRVLPEEMSF